ncbi:MAG: hypothetical protein U1F06_02105 [Steroidobacteraceae bacterium]
MIGAAGGNWRAGWWLIAALAALIALLVALVAREQPADLGQRPDGEAADGTGTCAARAARLVYAARLAAARGACTASPCAAAVLHRRQRRLHAVLLGQASCTRRTTTRPAPRP